MTLFVSDLTFDFTAAGDKDGNVDRESAKAVIKRSTFNTEHCKANSNITLVQSSDKNPASTTSVQPSKKNTPSTPLPIANYNTANAASHSKMSFRGGRGGARGGGGPKGATWEHDPDVKLESKPTELFPVRPLGQVYFDFKLKLTSTSQRHPNLKKPKPLTGREKRQIKAQKKFQDDVHRGPFYTEPTKRDADAPAKTFSEAQFNSRYGNKGKADIDPFHGVETYSQKYAPKKRTIPQLSARAPFDKSLFPKELWSVLEGESGEEVRKHINRSAVKKAAFMGTATKDSAEKTRIILEKIKDVGLEDDAEMAEDDEPVEEEPEDYDFEEDEEEMGGDYDGEKYFDNGEGDSGDEGDRGNDEY